MRTFLFTICLFFGLLETALGQCVFPSDPADGLICDRATFVCGDELNGFADRLPLNNPFPDQPLPGCPNQGSAENIIWFSFIVDDPDIQITIEYSNCTDFDMGPDSPGLGLQAGLYANCEDFEDEKVACRTNFGYSTLVLTSDASLLVPGQLCYFYIDGLAGSVCDFEITVDRGICLDPPQTPEECEVDCGLIHEYDHGCTGFTDIYTLRPQDLIMTNSGCTPNLDSLEYNNLYCIEWDIQPDVGFTIQDEVSGLINNVDTLVGISILWNDPGTYTVRPVITLNPQFDGCLQACDCSSNVIFEIEVEETTENFLGVVELCPGELYDFCNQMLPASVETALCYDRENCIVDRVILEELEMTTIDLGTQFICDNVCYELEGTQYCLEDSYSVLDTNACDTTYIFDVVDVNITPEFSLAETVIDCNNLTAEIVGSWVTNFTGAINAYWIDELNNVVDNDNELSVSSAGTYTFVVEPIGISSCVATLNHIVVVDDVIPDYTVMTPPVVDCNTVTESISVVPISSISSVSWTGPNGFDDLGFSISISEGGMYYFDVVGSNGCIVNDSVFVETDTIAPLLEVFAEDINCMSADQYATYSTISELTSVQWFLSSGVPISISDSLLLDNAGSYVLEVTAVNGCVTQESFTVADLRYDPRLGVVLDSFWTCDEDIIAFDYTSALGENIVGSWSSINGMFDSNEADVNIFSPGQYILMTMDTIIGCAGYDTFNILVDDNPLSSIELNPLAPLCLDSMFGGFEIVDIQGGHEPFQFSSDGINFDLIENIALAPGDYAITIKDDFGCELISNITVPPAINFIYSGPSLVNLSFREDSILVAEVAEGSENIFSVDWFDSNGGLLGTGSELVLNGELSEVIRLVITSEDGCIIDEEITVQVSYEVDIYYPNVFSPNNDGQNDRFVFFNNGEPEMMDQVQIFDRLGSLVYNKSSQAFNEEGVGWDGTFNGSPVAQGVYVFLIRYTQGDGKEVVESGTVTVLR